MVVMGRHRWANTVVTGAILPLLLSVLYTMLIVTHWGEAEGGFGSLADIRALFANEWLLLAGWVRYLAFDLFDPHHRCHARPSHGRLFGPAQRQREC